LLLLVLGRGRLILVDDNEHAVGTIKTGA